MNKPLTLGALLASLFPRSNRALSEKLDTQEYNQLATEVQELNSRLNSGTAGANGVQISVKTEEPAHQDASTAPETTPEATTEAADLAEITLQEVNPDPQEESTTETAVAGSVPMQTVTLSELEQMRADAAAWNASKGEYTVLKDWYTRSTSKLPVSTGTDAADAQPDKVKSWEKAPWNTK